MEADISLQHYQSGNQAVGRKRNVKKMTIRSPGIKKELKDSVHDKDGRCGTHGEGANKVFEPQWVNGVYRKKWVWRCNVLAMKTEQKLKQTKISFFVKTNSGEAEGRGDTKMQLAAGHSDTVASASKTENFDNVTGQMCCDVQPRTSRVARWDDLTWVPRK